MSWGSAGAHRLHFEKCCFHGFPCTCSGQSCSVALKSSVISLVLKIKSNIIQKSITGPFSVTPGSFPAILSMHQYSLPTLVLFTTLKVPEPCLLQGPSVHCALFCIFMLCFFFFLGKFALHKILNRFLLTLQVSYFRLLPWVVWLSIPGKSLPSAPFTSPVEPKAQM